MSKYSLYIFPIISILWLTFPSCQQSQDEAEKLRNDIIDIHDEVMPETDHILAYKELISQKLELLTSDSTEIDSANVKQLTSLKNELDEAEEGMMQWMRAYADSMDVDMELESMLSYLKKEKEKITEVKESMESSITHAKNLLGELPPDK